MKFALDYFNQMTAGRSLGRRIFGRYGAMRVNTYHRFIQGFVPPYVELANEAADPDFQQTIIPAYPLKRAPGFTAIRGKNGAFPAVILPDEGSAGGSVVYTTDLWHFYIDDATEIDLGIPNGTPATNYGIDAVIFNSKILTSHPLNSNLYYGDISPTPAWTSISASLNDAAHVLKVIEDQCLVLDSSQGAFKPRDRVKIVQADFSIIDGFAIGSSDFDIKDIAEYQGRYALLFAIKTASSSADPTLLRETTVFLWNIVPGDSYDLKISLPGIYVCSIEKGGVLYAFTQIGNSLGCFAFNGTGFQEVGVIKNVIVSQALNIPKTRVAVEGDFFVLLASSPGNTSTAPFYWNPSTNESFFLCGLIDNSPIISLQIALNPSSSSYARYFGYQNQIGNGTLYKCTLEDDGLMDVVSNCYDESNRDGNFVLPGSSDDASAAAQSFTAKGGTLSQATLFLAKQGTPTGNMVAKLYAHSGTYGTSGVPTGAALATSDLLAITNLTTSFANIAFTFSGANKVKLDANEHYFISFEYTGGDSSNRPKVGSDTSSPSAPGNAAIFSFSTWSAVAGTDIIFTVTEEMPSNLAYASNPIPAPLSKGEDQPGTSLGRIQIKHLEVLFNAPPPTSDDSITLSLITKDEYESETYTTQTAVIKDTTANSTNAKVAQKRAIISLGASATEVEIDLAATIATASWNLIIRNVIVVYEPVALQN